MSEPGPADSLRERKKTATRRALHEAAVRLALADGLADLTVEAIADACGVSRRTFSNYFANKEAALLYGQQQRMQLVLDELRHRPADEPPWVALRRSARVLYVGMDEPDPQWAAQVRLLRSHPTLTVQRLSASLELEVAIAAELTHRFPDATGEPLRSRIVAAAFLSAIRTAVQLWVEDQGGRSLQTAVDEAITHLSPPARPIAPAPGAAAG